MMKRVLLILLVGAIVCIFPCHGIVNGTDQVSWERAGFLVKILVKNETGFVISCTATMVSTSMVLTHPHCIQNRTSGQRFPQIVVSLPYFFGHINIDTSPQKWSTVKVLEVDEHGSWALLRFTPQSINHICPMNSARKSVIPLNYPAKDDNLNLLPMAEPGKDIRQLLETNDCFMVGFRTSERAEFFLNNTATTRLSIIFKNFSDIEVENGRNVRAYFDKVDGIGCFDDCGAPLLCKHVSGTIFQVGIFESLRGIGEQKAHTLNDCLAANKMQFRMLPNEIFEIVKRYGKEEVERIYDVCKFSQIRGEESSPNAPPETNENGIEAKTIENGGSPVINLESETEAASVSDESCGVSLQSGTRGSRSAAYDGDNLPSYRIEHGQQTHENDYPFIAYVAAVCTNKNGEKIKLQHCTGTIVQKRWILTAAHCTHQLAKEVVKHGCTDAGFPSLAETLENLENPENMIFMYPLANMKVIVGTNKYDKINPNWRNVAMVIRHASYRSNSNGNDIALLQLEKPLEFGSTINRICLSRNFEPNAGDTAVIAGYGLTKGAIENGNQIEHDKDNLREDLVRFKTDGCPAGFICQDHSLRKTTHGDSGGPLMRTRTGYGAWYQIGLVRGHASTLNLFTRIGPHCDWMHSQSSKQISCTAM